MSIDTAYVDYTKDNKRRIKDHIQKFRDTKWGNIPNHLKEEMEEELFYIDDDEEPEETIEEYYITELEEQDYYDEDDNDDYDDEYDEYGYWYDSFPNYSWDYGCESDYDDDDLIFYDYDYDDYDDYDSQAQAEFEAKIEEQERAEYYAERFRGTKWCMPRSLRKEYEDELY
ncbi:MAG: hypothetical protein IKG14_00705 [Clostridia bacterium]|nr:hypothetical protein [Clostridia bacterium]